MELFPHISAMMNDNISANVPRKTQNVGVIYWIEVMEKL